MMEWCLDTRVGFARLFFSSRWVALHQELGVAYMLWIGYY